jgi:hypothetical protein
MKQNNPAIFECPKNTIHTWQLHPRDTATCTSCGLKLNKKHTDELVSDLPEHIIAV